GVLADYPRRKSLNCGTNAGRAKAFVIFAPADDTVFRRGLDEMVVSPPGVTGEDFDFGDLRCFCHNALFSLFRSACKGEVPICTTWATGGLRKLAARSRIQNPIKCASDAGGRGHDVSRDRPQNAPNADAFGLNRLRRFGYENTCGHFDFGAADHYRGGLYRPAFHKRPGNCAAGTLSGT